MGAEETVNDLNTKTAINIVTAFRSQIHTTNENRKNRDKNKAKTSELLRLADISSLVVCNLLGLFSGVWCLIADVSEYCVCFIFIGEWMRNE
jgi:hypothetical protein